MTRWSLLLALAGLLACGTTVPTATAPAAPTPVAALPPAREDKPASPRIPEPAGKNARNRGNEWRLAHRLIDVHMHVEATIPAMEEAVRVMDDVGIGVGLNLSGGVVTHAKGQTSAFEQTKSFADEHFPGRFLESMNLDYSAWDTPGFAQNAVAQVEEGARLGAAGFKEFKRLGLFLRDIHGKLLRIDDPKLDPMWSALGRLGMPVSIHAADPKAFWRPDDASNERWKELKDHPRWWFGDRAIYPSHEELLSALERVVARHPETTFICVHFGNNAEDLDWVDGQLDSHPNMLVDLAARIPEVGRHDPKAVRAFFIKHQDRILFATDFQVYDRMTLGSSGNESPPTERDAVDFFQTHYRFFETADLNFPHMTPIQGDWTISAIDLPETVLAKVYFSNAERVFAKPLSKLPKR